MLWCVRVNVCVEEKIALREEGNYQVQQLRGGDGERTNSAAIQSVLAFKLVPEYLHFPSISSCPPPPPDSRDLQRLGGTIERASLLRTTTIQAKVARASRGLSSVITILHHGVLISPVWPTEGNRLVQCALTETNRHLPASMASNTHRRVFRKRARQSSPPYTILPGQEPILPWRPSRPASLLQRWPSSRRPSR